MTILVTGATGNIGRCVVDRLVGAGQRVRAMARAPKAARLAAGVEVVYGDFVRPETWADALKGVERVHLFPFSYAVPDSEIGFVDEAVKAGVRRFVVHSAAAAEFPPGDDQHDLSISPLRRHLAMERDAHREQELLVEASGAEWTHVRPGLLAAGALSWADQIRAGQPVREPHGAAGEALVHEADVAEVAVAALLTDDHLGAAYTITGPAKVSQVEQVAAIAAATGQYVRFEENSLARGAGALAARGLSGRHHRLADGLVGGHDRRSGSGPGDRYLRTDHRTPGAHLRAMGHRPRGRLPRPAAIAS